jgi:hypothetical protein
MKISKKSTVVLSTVLGVAGATGIGAVSFANEVPLFGGTSGVEESVENGSLELPENLESEPELAPLESDAEPAVATEEASPVSAASADSEASPVSAASADSEASPVSAASADSEASPVSAASADSAPSSD